MTQKFKVWDKVSKEWIAGILLIDNEGNIYYRGKETGGCRVEKNNRASSCFEAWNLNWLDKDCYEIVFSTGLSDKNRNEIYSGDIVKFLNENEGYDFGEIQYGKSNCAFNFFMPHLGTGIRIPILNFMRTLGISPDYDFEIVNNIFEAPKFWNKNNKQRIRK